MPGHSSWRGIGRRPAGLLSGGRRKGRLAVLLVGQGMILPWRSGLGHLLRLSLCGLLRRDGHAFLRGVVRLMWLL